MTGWYMKLKYTIINKSKTQPMVDPIIVINLPAGLTVRSRKMHRACLNYSVTGGYVADSQSNLKITFATAYDNWVTRAAIKRGRNHWLEMHREIFKNNPQLKPKWHDYKPALLEEQLTSNNPIETQWVPEDYLNQTLPHDDRGQTYSVFTTEDSKPNVYAGSQPIVDPNKDEFTSHIVGKHITTSNGFTSIGLITSWEGSRPDIEPITTVDSAEMDAITEDPLNMLFNDGDADNEIIENFDNSIEGDSLSQGDMFPMYANEVINSLEEVARTATSSASPISYFTGFTALTGQVALKVQGSIAPSQNFEVVFEDNPKGETI